LPRIFFGLELPPGIKSRLLKVRSAVPGAKWQSAEQLHITLLFLGSVEEEVVSAVCDQAREILMEPFVLGVAGLSCFGHPQKPRNLWAGVQPEAPVAGLHDGLKGRMTNLGFEIGGRTFRPHITLARFKRQAGSVEDLLTEHTDSEFGHFPVTEFVLFGSKPGPTESVYTVIERFPLRGAD